MDFDGVQIWRNRIYSDMMDVKRMFDHFKPSEIKAVYEVEMKEREKYDKTAWKEASRAGIMFSEKLTLEMEKFYYGLEMVGTSKILPTYVPNAYEMSRFAKEVKNCKMYTKDERAKAKKILPRYILFLRAEDESWDGTKEDIPDDTTIASSVADLAAKAKVTKEEVKNYLVYRHEMMARAFCRVNGISMARTDVKLRDLFYEELKDVYPEALRKTPDVVHIATDGSMKIFEFTVTNANWVTRLNEKVDKYATYINYLRDHSGISVEYIVVLYDMTNQVFRTTASTGAYKLPDMTRTHGLESIMCGIPNYREMRTKLDVSNFRNDEIILERAEEVLKELRISKLDEIKAPSLRNSREMDKDLELITSAEDELFQMVYARDTATSAAKMAKDLRNRYARAETVFNFCGPEVAEIVKQATEEGSEDVRSRINELLEEGEAQRENSTEKIPCLFKLPLLTAEMKGAGFHRRPRDMTVLDDGTMLFRAQAEILKKAEEVEWSEQEDRTGIGHTTTDVSLIKRAMRSLGEVTENLELGKMVTQFEATLAYRTASFWETLSREIMLMSERRFIHTNNPCNFAFKQFPNFSLEMHKGPKLTKGKVVRIKFHVDDDGTTPVKNRLYHTFYRETDSMGTKSTKWLTMTLTDLEHFVTLASRMKVILADMEFKIQEDSTMEKEMERRISRIPSVFPNLIMVPMLIMMEHKRNTSTTAQLPRYVLHASTSILGNIKGMAEEVISLPVRSLLQSFLVRSQLWWMMRNGTKVRESWKFYVKMSTDSKSYDKFHMTSFYDEDFEIEFSLIMNEIYYSNIFNQAHGMKSHREKQIMEKMAKEELNYKKVKDRLHEEIPFSEFMGMKDTHHVYSSEFIRTAMRDWMNKEGSKDAIIESLLHAETETLSDVIKLTKSVTSAPTPFRKFLSWSSQIRKQTVLEAVMDEFDKLSEPCLQSICEEDEELYAIFGTFAKDQFGGAREILVQCIRTRIHTAYLNSFFKKLCSFHPKEMITKERHKREIQASTMEEMRNDLVGASSSSSPKMDLPVTINADASKWAPSMVMEYYLECMAEMEVATDKRDYFCSVFRAYGSKMLFAPQTLVKKWKDKPKSIKETSEFMEWIRNEMKADSGELWFFSGMGQGNFQHPSSFFHCVMDDLADEIMIKVLSEHGIEVPKMTTLISSDDSTKMMLIRMNKLVWEEDPSIFHKRLRGALVMIADIFTTCKKAANIHINWKKTAVQAIITEFNSVFSIGKRVAVASIKSIYNSMNIVDMTFPERAVREAISHIRPMMDDGVALPVLRVAFVELRKQLIAWYNLKGVINALAKQLECTEADLPFQLGFLSLENIYEQMVYGPEYNMFKYEPDTKIGKFFRGLYTAPIEDYNEEDYWINKEEIMSGAFKIKLDTRLNRAIEKIKKERVRDREAVQSWDNKMALNKDLNNSTPNGMDVYMQRYWMGISLMYELGETFRVNSMIRSMQLIAKPFATVPPIKKKIDEDHTDYKQYKKWNPFWKVGEEVSMRFSNMTEFVSMCLKRSKMDGSFKLFTRLQKIFHRTETAKLSLKMATEKTKSVHSKVRSISFYDVTTSANASAAEILDCIFDSGISAKTRVFRAVLEVCSALNVDHELLMRNPFHEISKLFKSKDSAFSNFRVFLEFFCKTMYNKMISMLSPFPSCDKAVDNIVMLYSFMSIPGKQLEIRAGALSHEYTKMLQDAMLFLKAETIPDALNSALSRKKRSISEEDSRAEWAVKIIAKMIRRRRTKSGTVEELNPHVPLTQICRNRPLFFRKRSENIEELFYSGVNSHVRIRKVYRTTNVNVDIQVFENEEQWKEFEIDPVIRGLVVTDLVKTASENTSVYYTIKAREDNTIIKDVSETVMSTESLEVILNRFKNFRRGKPLREKPEVVIERSLDRWWLRVYMFNTEETSIIPYKASDCIMTDTYKMSKAPMFAGEEQVIDLLALTHKSASLSDTLSIMMKQGVAKALTVPKHKDKVAFEYKFDLNRLLAMAEREKEPAFGSLIRAGAKMAQTVMTALNETAEEDEEDEPYLTADERILALDKTNLFDTIMAQMSDWETTDQSSTAVMDVEVFERPAIMEDAYSCLTHAFLQEFLVNFEEINRMARKSSSAFLSVLFTQIKTRVEDYVEFEVEDSLIMYLTMSVATRSEMVFRETNFAVARNIEDTRVFENFHIDYVRANIVGDDEEELINFIEGL